MKLFDFTKPQWGWHAEPLRKLEGDEYEFTGHGKGIEVGDLFVVKGTKLPVNLNKVVKIEYMKDPTDQWFATVTNMGSCETVAEVIDGLDIKRVDVHIGSLIGYTIFDARKPVE